MEPLAQEFPDLVEGVFPACQVHLIGGSRGAGKTAFECWMAGHVLRGEPFLGHETHKPPFWGALIMDRGDKDRLAWWKAAGIDPLPYYSLTNDKAVTPETLTGMDTRTLIRFLGKKLDDLNAPPGGVVTIDVANFFSGVPQLGYPSGFAHGWALTKNAHDRQITILALMHGGKQKGPEDRYVRATDRIIGSTGFLGAVSTVSYLTTKAELGTGYQEYTWEPHHSEEETFRLARTENGLFRLLDNKSILELKEKHEVTRDDYLVFFPPRGSDTYTTTGEVTQKCVDLWGLHPVSIRRNIIKLKEEGKIVNWHGEEGKWQKIVLES